MSNGGAVQRVRRLGLLWKIEWARALGLVGESWLRDETILFHTPPLRRDSCIEHGVRPQWNRGKGLQAKFFAEAGVRTRRRTYSTRYRQVQIVYPGEAGAGRAGSRIREIRVRFE